MGALVKRSLGISVSGEHASFVELGKALGRVRVLTSGTFSFRHGETRPPHGQPERVVPEKAKELGSIPEGLSLKGSPDEVILGIPRRSVALRSLELPALEEKDLSGLLAYEIERHLPFPPEEACYGFQRFKSEGGKAKVLLAAARKADVERHIERLEALGLHPTAVDVSAFAAANAVVYHERPSSGETLCLIGLEEGQAEVSVIREGVLLSSRAIALDDGALGPLLREVQRVLDEEGETRMKIRVSGGSGDLRLRLQEELGLPVEPWNPAGSSGDASAFGLALKGLVKLSLRMDLLPPERRRKRREPAVVAMFALLALLVVLGGALVFSSAYREQRTLSWLTQRVAEAKTQAAEVEALKREFTRLRNRLGVLDGFADERGRALLVLRELVSLLPGNVALTEVSLEGNRLQIRGTTGTSASELISAFEGSSLFENAAFTSPISAQGSDRQGFQIQAFVKGNRQRAAGNEQGPAGSGQQAAGSEQRPADSEGPAAPRKRP